MNRLDTIIDLITRAMNCNAQPEKNRLVEYMDLYAEEKYSVTAEYCGLPEKRFMDIIPLNGKELENLPDTEELPPEPGTADERGDNTAFSGAGGAEKKRIFNRLDKYRRTHTEAVYKILSDFSAGKLKPQEISMMYYKESFPIERWRELDKALELAGE